LAVAYRREIYENEREAEKFKLQLESMAMLQYGVKPDGTGSDRPTKQFKTQEL